MELVSMHTSAKPYAGDNFIIRTYEIYHELIFEHSQTRITIIDADTKRETVITLPYILHDKEIVHEMAKALIQTRGMQ